MARALLEQGRTIRRALWLGETDGLYDDQGHTVPRLSAADFGGPLRRSAMAIGEPSGTDVTGGMRHRVETPWPWRVGTAVPLLNGLAQRPDKALPGLPFRASPRPGRSPVPRHPQVLSRVASAILSRVQAETEQRAVAQRGRSRTAPDLHQPHLRARHPPAPRADAPRGHPRLPPLPRRRHLRGRGELAARPAHRGPGATSASLLAGPGPRGDRAEVSRALGRRRCRASSPATRSCWPSSPPSSTPSSPSRPKPSR